MTSALLVHCSINWATYMESNLLWWTKNYKSHTDFIILKVKRVNSMEEQNLQEFQFQNLFYLFNR